MQIVRVNLRDMRIGDDDEGEVAEGLYPVGEARRQNGESEVRRGKKLLGCEWWPTMSVVKTTSQL